MRKVVTWLLSLAVVLWLSVTPAAAQGRGKGGEKPSQTGLEHAETVANPHGQRGIENAEAKQGQSAKESQETSGKHKGKHKKHHKKHKDQDKDKDRDKK